MSRSEPATTSGYRRSDGQIGVRNHVLVLPSVICSHQIADRIADQVGTAVSAPHDHGCAQLGSDNERTERTLANLAANPNVAGSVVVGLGCEEVQSDSLAETIAGNGRPVRELSIQGVGGTDACLERGVEMAEELVEAASQSTQPTDLGDLTVGIVASDLADSTVSTAAPRVAAFVDEVIDAGGRVVAAGNEPMLADPDAALEAVEPAARADAERLLDRNLEEPAKVGRVRRRAEEISFAEATGAWGDHQVQDLLEYGARATHDSGVALVDAPSEFASATTALASAGAGIVIHLTADGVPAGHPVVPVVKVTGDSETAAALPEDIDVDAATDPSGTLRRTVEGIVAGEDSAPERHGLTTFAIDRIGPSM
ncbi:UxaA family hydrolase [Natronomonas sp. F2-12]|uniref:UxaA family hydrolase n=1 Tax=Natronomonas aquatica TaxID=2841590 RepID=A0A9R1CR13_9EURY|nr:UxaA family hydrolase [Natronomonas aquatica]